MTRRQRDLVRHLDWAWRRCPAWFASPPTILNVAECLGLKPCDVVDVFDFTTPGRIVRGWGGGRLVAGAGPR